mgnify:FL=1
MLFNNSSNKIRIIGFLVSEVKIINAYAIEFLIAVPRKVKKGEQGFNDVFTVYANEASTISFAKNHSHKGCVVVVKGELRTFTDKSVKICSSDITISSQNK